MTIYTEELYHYGILGMKWGVRRYRNPDGSLTAAGKKKRDKLYAKVNKEHSKTISAKYKKIDKIRYRYGMRLARGTATQKSEAKKRYKIKKIENWIKADRKLKNLQKSEIKKGLDYYERMMFRRLLIGQAAAGPVGQIFGALSADLSAKKKFGGGSYKKRKEIGDEYAERNRKAKEWYKKDRTLRVRE